MRDIDLSDDQIRVELKRIVEHEKAWILRSFGETQAEILASGPEMANPGMAPEIVEQKLREIHEKFEQKREEVSFFFQKLMASSTADNPPASRQTVTNVIAPL